MNTLIASLFVYKMLVLLSMPAKLIQRLDQLIKTFLWNGKKAKIAYGALQLQNEHGGLKLCNLKWKDIALKVTWVSMVQEDPSMHAIVNRCLSTILKQDIWRCNLNQSDSRLLFNKSPFWTDVLVAWTYINYKRVDQVQDPAHQFIWYNSNICIQNKPFVWQHSLSKGLKTLGQLIQNRAVISARNAMDVYGLSLMEYNSLVSAILSQWKGALKDTEPSDDQLKPIMCLRASQVYAHLCFNETKINHKVEKWAADMNKTITTEDFLQCFQDILKVTNITKYQSFQYRLLHRALVLNTDLYKWKVIQSPMCTLCKTYPETYLRSVHTERKRTRKRKRSKNNRKRSKNISGKHQRKFSLSCLLSLGVGRPLHLFVFCRVVKDIWIHIEELMLSFSEDPVHFDIDMVICNRIINNPCNIKNFICLVTKQYIYRQRSKDETVNFQQLRKIIKSLEASEKYYAMKNNRVKAHLLKWGTQSGTS